MIPLQIKEIIKATEGNLISGNPLLKVRGISTNTRTLLNGDLFIALKGEKFDGNVFLEEALERGAAGAVVARDCKIQNTKYKNKIIIKVDNTVKALGSIAKTYREKFNIPVIAITGSNGKTTTKEILAHILSRRFNTIKAKASFNNFIGLSLTLLEIKSDTQVVILEMETNLINGISRLCEIAHPKIGIVTNIGNTHLEYLKTKEGVYNEKLELVESLPSDGVAVLNFDDPYVIRMKEFAKAKRIVSFGIENKSHFSASKIKIGDTFLEFTLNDNYKVRLNTISKGNVYNCLTAVAVAHSVFGLNLKEVIANLKDVRFPPMRMELIKFSIRGCSERHVKDIRIINDSYNANPQSMQEALFTLRNVNTSGRKIAVLGNMLELGKRTLDLHYQIGRLCAGYKVDILITVGNMARRIADSAKENGMPKEKIYVLDNTQKTIKILFDILKSGDVILIKGSRKMKMEKIVNALMSKIIKARN